MNLPIRFPNDADVIAEDAARFRALPSEERMRWIVDTIKAGELPIATSGRADELRRLADEEKRLERLAISEFVARHGGSIVVDGDHRDECF